MKILRILLGLAVLAWAMMCLVLVAGMPTLYKLGQLKDMPLGAQRMIPLYETTAWWHIAITAVVVVLWLVAAWRLFRGGRAFPPFALGLVGFIAMKTTTAYDQVFTPAELRADNYIWAGLVVVGALIWLTERKRA